MDDEIGAVYPRFVEPQAAALNQLARFRFAGKCPRLHAYLHQRGAAGQLGGGKVARGEALEELGQLARRQGSQRFGALGAEERGRGGLGAGQRACAVDARGERQRTGR